MIENKYSCTESYQALNRLGDYGRLKNDVVILKEYTEIKEVIDFLWEQIRNADNLLFMEGKFSQDLIRSAEIFLEKAREFKALESLVE